MDKIHGVRMSAASEPLLGRQIECGSLSGKHVLNDNTNGRRAPTIDADA